MKSNEIQIQLEELGDKSKLKDLDDFETEEELKKYLETLDLSELIEIYYTQSCEMSNIRKLILDSVKEND